MRWSAAVRLWCWCTIFSSNAIHGQDSPIENRLLQRQRVDNKIHKKLFYIYSLPSNMTDLWPDRNIELNSSTVWKHAFNENEGFGRHYENTSYFETWQYAGFRIILSRLLRSSYRTYNKSQASLFFVPYDSGTECYVDTHGNYKPRGNPNARMLMQMLRKDEIFLKNHGYDFFFVHSTSLVAHKTSLKLKELFELCSNATILTVEELPVVHHYHSHLPFRQPIPMASMYHWHKEEKRRSVPAFKIFSTTRNILVSFFGSASTSVPTWNHLRTKLFEQCAALNSHQPTRNISQLFSPVCLHNSLTPGASRDTARADIAMKAYEKSVFCLCPPGDTPIRRAIFDALLAGCIPVLFQSNRIKNSIAQYSWHFTRQEIENIFIFLDASNVSMLSYNHLDTLASSYSASDVQRRQKAISLIARRIQYSVPPDVREIGMPSVLDRTITVWDSPFRDAFDVVLEGLFSKVGKYVTSQI